MNLSRLQRDTAGRSCGIALMARRIGALAALVIGLAVALDLGHAVGGSAITVQTSADSTYAMHLEQEVTLRVSLSAAPPTGQTVMVLLGVASERISRVVQYSVGQGAHKQNQVLVFTDGNWSSGQTVTVRAIKAGRAALTTEMMIDGGAWSNRTVISRIEVHNNTTGASIKIEPKAGDPWAPMILEWNIYSPFDHIMGEGEQVTYQISIVDPTACPATVDIRGRPRYPSGGELPRYRRFDIRKGSLHVPHAERMRQEEISVTLEFTGSNCANQPQDVTVYGIADFAEVADVGGTPAYVILKHTLTKRGSTDVNEPGPVFRLYGEDEYIVNMSAAVPPVSSTAPRVMRTISKHGVTNMPPVIWYDWGIPAWQSTPGSARTPQFVNSVGPVSRAGESIRSAKDRDEVYVILPKPASAGTGSATTAGPWAEFCVYITDGMKSQEVEEHFDLGDDVIHLYRTKHSGVGLPQLTLIPFEYEQLNWYARSIYVPGPEAEQLQLASYGGGYANWIADRVNTHYGLPIELQWYTDVQNDHNSCNVASTFTGFSDSKWETVYAGGPAALTADGSPSAWTHPTGRLTLPQEDWGKMVNVRMRAAYGLPRASLPERWRILGGEEKTFDATIVEDSANMYRYRAPVGTMLLKFTFEELGGQSKGASIIVLFEDP